MLPQAAVPPAGTFAPGTKIQVGNHRVQIQKYLSEGGFAHVYLVKLPKPVDGTDLAVLKRVAVPDKEALRGMRTEVETMKRLKGHRAIVTYIDSHASELQGGGYEVFLLMEYCDGGGLIDFMNTRLQHRLTEPEILNIFADIAEGVACMHYLKPALLHRDLKVENVLITSSGSGKRFKVCDFGSAAPPRPAPTTVVECRLMDEDVQRHTTLQYRSPEMIDVYRKQPIDEKSDIWALGVLLYKLCYYTTPFEDQGQLAILNASYKYPSYPVFSDRLKQLIASMLKENMSARPNIYQVLKEACVMQGREIPVHDIYAAQNNLQTRHAESVRSRDQPVQPTPVVGAVFAASVEEPQAIPDIIPMRRGRPTPSSSAGHSTPRQPSASGKVTEGDPFAALDTKLARKLETDELSSRFPSLDQFSLLHDNGGFHFDSTPMTPAVDRDENSGISERLADEAFASSRNISSHPSPTQRPQTVAPIMTHPETLAAPLDQSSKSVSHPSMSRAQSIIRNNPELTEIASKTSKAKAPAAQRSWDLEKERQSMGPENLRNSAVESRTYSDQREPKRQPSDGRTDADPRSSASSIPRQLSQSHMRSSRASIDTSRSSTTDLIDLSGPSDAPGFRQRPISTTFEPSTLEFLRERENARESAGRPILRQPRPTSRQSSFHLPLATAEIPHRRSEEIPRTRGISGSRERNSAGSNRRLEPLSVPGSKNLFAGKFGDAFKRFENNISPDAESASRPESPQRDLANRILTPIAGSEITADDRSDGSDDDDKNEADGEHFVSAETRRDMERRRLEAEEARVGAAQAEYRRQIAETGPTSKPVPGPKRVGGAARAASIQERVQNLLQEEQRAISVPRTAQGYGKYTDTVSPVSEGQKTPLEIRRKPLVPSKAPMESPSQSNETLGGRSSTSSLTAVTTPKSQVKPSAPKKPTHLNSIPTGGRQTPKLAQPAQFERLIAMDLPGRPMLDITTRERDDYIEDFAKRFPSLSTIELNHTGEGGRSG
ncbi:Serine/threonine-protein kinase ppk30 [Escovopsis weberi]|uniref:non-specific serine/threonine protein kinase n=1 Tax=Escovopsis weberi TaxID=150374 RepID=A0A0M8N3Y2_ESCWE|nr:Serine/threonine-protein kinase ppk30 [Escovopsis weberi]